MEDPPDGFVPSITTVENTVDEESGKPIIVREMPLPHIFHDLNKPAHKNGKGAKWLGGNR